MLEVWLDPLGLEDLVVSQHLKVSGVILKVALEEGGGGGGGRGGGGWGGGELRREYVCEESITDPPLPSDALS